MKGEAWVATHHAEKRLAELLEAREMLRLWGEDNLHPFVLARRLQRYDDEIARCEEELLDWEEMNDELLEEYLEEYEDDRDADPFSETFDELCRIDGVSPAPHLDRVVRIPGRH